MDVKKLFKRDENLVDSKQFEKIWQMLYPRINGLLDGEKFTPTSFMELYNNVMDACDVSLLFDGSALLYERLKEQLQQYLMEVVKGDEIFQNVSEEEPLPFYMMKWKSYKIGSEHLNRSFEYLNRRIFQRGVEHMYNVQQLALITWKDMIIDRHHEQWTTIIFDLISKAKNGEEMDSVIRSGLGLYKEFNILLRYIRKDGSQSTIPCSSIFYSNENEIPYGNLNQYQNEIEKLVPLEQKIEDLPFCYFAILPKSNILEFLIKVQKTLLQKNWALYLEEIESLLAIKKTEFIKRVYTLLKRLKMTVELDEMKNCLKNHFRLALQQASFTNQNVARTYVDRVLSSHREQTTIAKSISETDTMFLEMLDKLCLQFLIQSQNSTQKLPDVLAAHCNSILSKSKTKISEQELEASLKQVLYLYDYLEDRDIFEMLYRKMMASRIVSRNSASPEAESLMVEKMRLKFEFGYVSKLDGMLKAWNYFVIVKFEDAKFSKELTANFNTSLGEKASSLPLVFDIIILSSANWPSIDLSLVELPTTLQHCVIQFNEFYKATCRNRKLQWLHDHSRGEILSSCFQKRYCFKASTLQMTVLLLFNSEVSYSIGELGELTKLGVNCLLHVLESLIKAKILIALNGAKEVDLNSASVISLVKTYENARLHVDIAPPIELKEDQFWRLSHKSIRKDSSIRIQAVIVRIMRRNRVMRHDSLVAEVLEQKSSLNYAITAQVVEAGINTLIENGDLVRKDGQHDEYVYEV